MGVAKEVVKGGVKLTDDALKAVKEEFKRFKNRDPEKAVTKTGEKSQGLIIGKDGKVTHAMGPSHVKIQENINQVKGGKKGLAAGLVLGTGVGAGGTYVAMKGSDKKDSDKKDSKKLTPFEKAFKAAADSGKKTFTFKGRRYNTDRKTEDPKVLRKAVKKKAKGGIIQAAKTITKKKTASRNKASATKWENKWG
jgi:hypothetical protein